MQESTESFSPFSSPFIGVADEHEIEASSQFSVIRRSPSQGSSTYPTASDGATFIRMNHVKIPRVKKSESTDTQKERRPSISSGTNRVNEATRRDGSSSTTVDPFASVGITQVCDLVG